jgi:phosphotransferase system HPr-like phosphotransfer protein
LAAAANLDRGTTVTLEAHGIDAEEAIEVSRNSSASSTTELHSTAGCSGQKN